MFHVKGVVKMSDDSLKCYGIYIDAAEVVLNIPTGVMDKFLENQNLVGVYQDPDGQRQVLIYNKKDQAKQAVEKAKSLGLNSAEMCPTMIYVPENAVQNKGVNINESNNGC